MGARRSAGSRLWRLRLLLRGGGSVQRAGRLQHLDGARPARRRHEDRLVEPAAAVAGAVARLRSCSPSSGGRRAREHERLVRSSSECSRSAVEAGRCAVVDRTGDHQRRCPVAAPRPDRADLEAQPAGLPTTISSDRETSQPDDSSVAPPKQSISPSVDGDADASPCSGRSAAGGERHGRSRATRQRSPWTCPRCRRLGAGGVIALASRCCRWIGIARPVAPSDEAIAPLL